MMFTLIKFLMKKNCTVTAGEKGFWSNCPQNLTVYECCPYTIQHIFTAADNFTCDDYHFSIEVNWHAYRRNQ